MKMGLRSVKERNFIKQSLYYNICIKLIKEFENIDEVININKWGIIMECWSIRNRSLDLANLTKPDIVCIVDNVCYYSSVYFFVHLTLLFFFF